MATSSDKPAPYGPDNPHPLSRMKTELVWEGKYDEFGNRREVDVAGCAMPMQRIETVDEPRQRAAAEGQTDMFERKLMKVREETPAWPDFRNRLIWGDNKLVMASLLKEFKGKIDLIYIDPPFDVGADFTMDVPIGDENETVAKDQSTMEMVAYRDTWGKGTDSYLFMLYERLALMKQLLRESGSIYVHCDDRVNGYVRLMLDEVFEDSNFRSQVIRVKCNPKNYTSRTFGNIHDTIFFYSRSPHTVLNRVYSQRDDQQIECDFPLIEKESHRRYKTVPLHAKGLRNGPTGQPWRGLPPPPGRHWAYVPSTLDDFDQRGLVEWSSTGNPRLKQYADDDEGKALQDIWEFKDPGDRSSIYATEKPEEFLEHIIKASSNPGDLVADFFCGSGTTGAVAEKLGRRWIMADLGRFAIHTTRKRMIGVQRDLHEAGKPYRAFDVYNLGRYERQWWQKERFEKLTASGHPSPDEEHRRIVLEFFKAEVLTNAPSPLIHGRKAGAFCHVDGIDSMFSRAEATALAKAVAAAGGRECYCLAWEFEMDLHLTTAALEKEVGVKVKLVQIPREIMEKNRKSPPPFLEVALLEAAPVYRKVEGKRPNDEVTRAVDIKLVKFMPSLAEVPSKELEAIKARAMKHGMDFIDFWAVDFEWQPGKPFNHHWQDYRTRKDRSLQTVSDAGHVYPKKGTYTACVKVVDTFGCDTSTTVEVKV